MSLDRRRPTAITAPPDAPRYAAERPLPARRFVPGHGRRPTNAPSDPAGSLLEDGRFYDDFRFACDLYNHGYFWEAHEAWEDLWHECERGSAPRLLLQGLIQCAASVLKDRCRQPDAARRLAVSGGAKLRRVAAVAPILHGVSPGAFAEAIEVRSIGDDPVRWPMLRLVGLE